MSIKEVAKAVQAIRKSINEHGILSVRGNEVHLSNEVLESLLDESKVKPLILKRGSKDFPYEVSFISNNETYYSLYTSERMEEKIGGIPNGRKFNGNREPSGFFI
ncbi:hypothetical protein [Bacillus toyonensis]|uniref:hypothetical protein n=1 Tax=Bacillus toyonensis TaxID=155322 RepID=UPI0018A16BEE|nr:hypothetical protein [Bacillus toyonensis]MBF7147064.1 hypothetical protein [Bacillus toyonensis]MEC2348852.1 hypothetical protein [Bacillus toyonensis]MED3187505.1 hypothetical protein [Bacillus toyonensis]